MKNANQPKELYDLAHGYDRKDQIFDVISITLFFILEAYLLWRVLPMIGSHPVIVILGLVLGYIAADFMSGLVHWIGDTWGHPQLPIVGNGFIRPFREHHVDQMAITRHDFIQTNGSNCFATLIALVPTTFILLSIPQTPTLLFILTFVVALTLGVFGTNQFHKWSHLKTPPKVIGFFQEKHLILSPAHHSIHHASPYDRYYCITVGWLNPVLESIQFFPRAERFITWLTGAQPRQSDIKLTAIRDKLKKTKNDE